MAKIEAELNKIKGLPSILYYSEIEKISSINDAQKNTLLKNLNRLVKEMENPSEGVFSVLPKTHIERIENFIVELAKKIPSKNFLKEDFDSMLGVFLDAHEQINAIVDGCFALVGYQEKDARTKKLDEVVKSARFIGLKIEKRGDEYVQTEEDPTPPQVKDSEAFQKKFAALGEKTIAYLNKNADRKVFRSRDFLMVFRQEYAKQLKLDNNDLTGSDANRIINRYNTASPEYLTFVLTDEYLLNQLLEECFVSELYATITKDSAEKLKDYKEFESMEDLADIFASKQDSAVSENTIRQYDITLKHLENRLKLATNKGIKADLEANIAKVKQSQLKFCAIKKLITNHKQYLQGFEAKDISSFIKSIKVTDDLKVECDTSKLIRISDEKVKEAIKKTIEETTIDDVKKVFSNEQTAREQSDDEEVIDKYKGKTNDIPLLKIVRTVAFNSENKFPSINTIFSYMQHDAVMFNLSKMPKDTELTYDEWVEVLGVDIIEHMGDDPTLKATLETAKKDGKAFQLPEELFTQGIQEDTENHIIDNYAALLRLQEKHPDRKIEELSEEQINKELLEISKEIESGAKIVTDEEKAKIAKLRQKYRYLQAKDAEEVASPKAKKVLSNILADEEFKDVKDSLDKEVEEEPIGKDEQQNESSKENYISFGEKNCGMDKEALSKKLKGYNTKYLTKLIGDIIKTIKKTPILIIEKKEVVSEEPTPEDPKQPKIKGKTDEEHTNDNDDSSKNSENKSESFEIKDMITWMEGNKKDVINDSVIFDPKGGIAERARIMFGHLAELTKDNPEMLNEFLTDLAKGQEGAESIKKKIEDAYKGKIVNNGSNINKIKTDLTTYFSGELETKDKDSDCFKAFKEIIFAGEDFRLDDGVNYWNLINHKLLKTKEGIEQINGEYYQKAIEEIKSLVEICGEKEAMNIVLVLANTSPTTLTQDENNKRTSRLTEIRNQIRKDAGDKDFSVLLSLSPQTLTTILKGCSIPLISEDKKLLHQTVSELAVSMFDSEYKIADNIDTLQLVIGKERAKTYVKWLIEAGNDLEKRSEVINTLQSVVNLPLEDLNKADVKLLNDMIARGTIDLFTEQELSAMNGEAGDHTP